MTPEQEQKLNEVYEFIQSLKAHTTIPYEVEQAFRQRLEIDSIPLVTTDVKGADSEDLTINEGGAATKIALNDPVGFTAIKSGGTTRYYPYFNA